MPQAVFPILFAPPAALISKMQQMSVITIDVHETWPKQTLRNRYYIGGPNSVQLMTIPVKKPYGSHSMTHQVQIDYSEPWIDQHIKSLTTAYSKSPFFLYYSDAIFLELSKKHELLINLNKKIMQTLSSWLHLDIEMHYSDEFIVSTPDINDIRPQCKHAEFWPFENEYYQPFADRYGFRAYLSVFDILFNLGPEAGLLIKKHAKHAKIQDF